MISYSYSAKCTSVVLQVALVHFDWRIHVFFKGSVLYNIIHVSCVAVWTLSHILLREPI